MSLAVPTTPVRPSTRATGSSAPSFLEDEAMHRLADEDDNGIDGDFTVGTQ